MTMTSGGRIEPRNYEERATDFGNPNWVAYQTIVRTEVRRFTRIWVQTMIPPAITMTLYFIIFGSLIGSRVGEMGGFNYMAYIVPGLIMMSVITNSYANVSSSFLGRSLVALWKRCWSPRFLIRRFYSAM